MFVLTYQVESIISFSQVICDDDDIQPHVQGHGSTGQDQPAIYNVPDPVIIASHEDMPEAVSKEVGADEENQVIENREYNPEAGVNVGNVSILA